jgi:hypothetical protein
MKIMYQYLKGYPKARLLGIAHEEYVENCEALGNDYDTNNITKYNYSLIMHPISKDYALTITDTTHLPEVFLTRLTDQATMDADGWFDITD